MDDAYEKIVPTAWIVAYRRSFSDIPYSKEMFDALDKLRSKRFIEISDEMLAPNLSPQYEARHKIIDRCIDKVHSDQILEIASGFTTRGISMTENPKITYVEFDLPRVIEDKENITRELIAKSGKKHDNLYFEKGNALRYDDLYTATSHFQKKPITIVNEGLLRYLNFDEKIMIANNIHKLLEIYGGAWITSDITLKKLLEAEQNLKEHNKRISRMTGINFDENRFEDENHAMKFFGDLGFSIERHSFSEVKKDLVSPKNLKINDEDVGKLIDHALVYIMRIK